MQCEIQNTGKTPVKKKKENISYLYSTLFHILQTFLLCGYC